MQIKPQEKGSIFGLCKYTWQVYFYALIYIFLH